MKTIPIALRNHLAEDATTWCFLCRVECVGAFAGTVLGFTNLDTDIIYDDGNGDVTYRAENGFTPSRLQSSGDMQVDNADIDGWVSATGITEAQIRAGMFDSAELRIYRVNYMDLSIGHEIMGTGRAGETEYSSAGWKTEFRSLTQQLKQIISQVYSLTCRAQFGDSRCQMSLTWVAGTVTDVGAESDQVFSDTSCTEPTGWYNIGVIRWLTGNNAGAQMEVDSFTNDSADPGLFNLSLSMPFPIQVGDTYERRQDCDKKKETCIAYGNLIHFRGESFIPSDGKAMVPGAEIIRVSH